MSNPQIILYDEPTTGLDPITSRIIHELMFAMQKKFNITSLVISHDLEVFKYADKVALLYEGTIKWFGDAATIGNRIILTFISLFADYPKGLCKRIILNQRSTHNEIFYTCFNNFYHRIIHG